MIMRFFIYKHLENSCALGRVFGMWEPREDDSLTLCPKCLMPVVKVNSTAVLDAIKRNTIELDS